MPDTSNPIEAGAGSRPVVPGGYHTVTPWIISRDTAGLIVIGHAEFRIGDSVIMGFDAKPEWPDTPAFLRLYVEDADAAHRRAIEAGATSVTEVTHLYWGDRVGRVRDPLGNLWWLQMRVEEVDDAEMERRLGEKVWIERMEYVQGSLAFPPEPRT